MSGTDRLPIAIVLTTLPDEVDAAAFAQQLVDERLVACVNVLPPMMSIYRWKGMVERAREQQLIMKTTAQQVPALERRLRELHPYDVPELIVLGADASAAYGAWVLESTDEAGSVPASTGPAPDVARDGSG